MMDDPEPEVKSIALLESDRELILLGARLLMAQEPGQSRQDGAEQRCSIIETISPKLIPASTPGRSRR
jgi:hypothetical protein